MAADRLVYMANQIGTFFDSQGAEGAADAVADHLKKFWNRRMQQALKTHAEQHGDQLRPSVRAALEKL